jgi:HK97 family phage prohead protease
MIKLIAGEFSVDKAAADGEGKRTISGVAVPYNVFATVSDGSEIMFMPGSLPVDGKAPRLFMYHDASQPIGVVTERVDTPEAMLFAARISATSLGNDALVMAADGTIDQVSVGVNATKFRYDDDERMIVEAADWVELSLVPVGAFGDAANITDVAASIPQNPETVSHNEPVTTEETKTMTTDNTVAVEATIPTPALPAQPKRKFDLPTPGEYLAAMHIGGETFRNVAAAATEFMKSKQTALQAAAGDVITTDTPGLLPVPVLSPVFARFELHSDQLLQQSAHAPCQTAATKKHLFAQRGQRTQALPHRPTNLTHRQQPRQSLHQTLSPKPRSLAKSHCRCKTLTLLRQQLCKSFCKTWLASTCSRVMTLPLTQSWQALARQVALGQLCRTTRHH